MLPNTAKRSAMMGPTTRRLWDRLQRRTTRTVHPMGRCRWLSSNGANPPPIPRHHNDNKPLNNSNDDRLLIIGSGVAGSAAALIAAETYQIPVTMIYAGHLPTDCNSYWAQGGIIYRNYDKHSGDSAALLAKDIMNAGAGLCDAPAVHKLAEQGPDRVRQLLLDATERFARVPFDTVDGAKLSLCLEASHTAPRILHKADHTGRVITQHITQAVSRHPLITQIPHTVVTDLVVSDEGDGSQRCRGVYTLDRTTGRSGHCYGGRGTVLASGGLAGIYLHSTNPAGFNALGSSVALAARHGVACQDLEYVQFHPTSLYIPNESRFLLTEALRGEGAVLRDAKGRAFARDYHPDGELAPRDVVARAVFEESQKDVASAPTSSNNSQQPPHNAFLDITHLDAEYLHKRFPTIQTHLQARGLDLAQDRLPVIPAAHYTCGGVATDLHGRTSMRGLFAAGEAARTGLHGGNRLASTSLLEGLVFGASVADYVGSDQGREELLSGSGSDNEAARYTQPTSRRRTTTTTSLEPLHIENAAHRSMQLLRALRKTMWDDCGVVRTPRGVQRALETLREICVEADHLHAMWPTLETSAVRDAAMAGCAVAAAAQANHVSAGAHCIVPDPPEAESDDEEEDMDQAVAAAR